MIIILIKMPTQVASKPFIIIQLNQVQLNRQTPLKGNGDQFGDY
ncbi:hypothetical protein [Lederbergia citrisecunda]|nr:hypothetical protein [Lederbergia citrisecunda]